MFRTWTKSSHQRLKLLFMSDSWGIGMHKGSACQVLFPDIAGAIVLSLSILEWIQPSAVYISNCQIISYHTLQIVCNASTYLQLSSAQLTGGSLLLGCRLFTFYIQQQVNNTTELFNLPGKLKTGAEKAGGSRKKVHILWGYLWKFNWVVSRKWFVSQLGSVVEESGLKTNTSLWRGMG